MATLAISHPHAAAHDKPTDIPHFTLQPKMMMTSLDYYLNNNNTIRAPIAAALPPLIILLIIYQIKKRNKPKSEWISGGAYMPPTPKRKSRQEKVLECMTDILIALYWKVNGFILMVVCMIKDQFFGCIKALSKQKKKKKKAEATTGESSSDGVIGVREEGNASSSLVIRCQQRQSISNNNVKKIIIPQNKNNSVRRDIGVKSAAPSKSPSPLTDIMSPANTSISTWNDAVVGFSGGSDSDGCNSSSILSSPNLPTTRKIRPKRLSYSSADVSTPEQRPRSQNRRQSNFLKSTRNLKNESNSFNENSLPLSKKHAVISENSSDETKRRRVSFGQDQVRLYQKHSPPPPESTHTVTSLRGVQEMAPALAPQYVVTKKRSSDDLSKNVTKFSRREGNGSGSSDLSISWADRTKALRNDTNTSWFQISHQSNRPLGRASIRINPKYQASYPNMKAKRSRGQLKEEQVLAALLKASERSNENEFNSSSKFNSSDSKKNTLSLGSTPIPIPSFTFGATSSSSEELPSTGLNTSSDQVNTFGFGESLISENNTKSKAHDLRLNDKSKEIPSNNQGTFTFGSSTSMSTNAAITENDIKSKNTTSLFGSNSNSNNFVQGSKIDSANSHAATFTFGSSNNISGESSSAVVSGTKSQFSFGGSNGENPAGLTPGISATNRTSSGLNNASSSMSLAQQATGNFVIGGSNSKMSTTARRSTVRRRRTNR